MKRHFWYWTSEIKVALTAMIAMAVSLATIIAVHYYSGSSLFYDPSGDCTIADTVIGLCETLANILFFSGFIVFVIALIFSASRHLRSRRANDGVAGEDTRQAIVKRYVWSGAMLFVGISVLFWIKYKYSNTMCTPDGCWAIDTAALFARPVAVALVLCGIILLVTSIVAAIVRFIRHRISA